MDGLLWWLAIQHSWIDIAKGVNFKRITRAKKRLTRRWQSVCASIAIKQQYQPRRHFYEYWGLSKTEMDSKWGSRRTATCPVDARCKLTFWHSKQPGRSFGSTWRYCSQTTYHIVISLKKSYDRHPTRQTLQPVAIGGANLHQIGIWDDIWRRFAGK